MPTLVDNNAVYGDVVFKRKEDSFPTTGIVPGAFYISDTSFVDGNISEHYSEMRLSDDASLLRTFKDCVYEIRDCSTGGPNGVITSTGKLYGLQDYYTGLKIIFDISDFTSTYVERWNGINLSGDGSTYLGSKRVCGTKAMTPVEPDILMGDYRSKLFLIYDASANDENGGWCMCENMDSYLSVHGGYMSGDINMGHNSITYLDDLTDSSPSHYAANKRYVDESINEAEHILNNYIYHEAHGVATSEFGDVLVDEINGTYPVNILYAVTGKKEGHLILNFKSGEYMESNSMIHLFIYAAAGREEPESGNGYPVTHGGTYATISNVNVWIPHNLCGGKARASVTENDEVWINDIKTNGSDSTGHDVMVTIPIAGMAEVSIFYNLYTYNNTTYTRTIIKFN